jgi:hypothetical protein
VTEPRRNLERAAGVGVDIVRRRAAFYAGVVTAVIFGILALLVIGVLALAGHAPSPLTGLLIVVVAAALGGIGARAAVLRISLMAALAMAIRYVTRRAGRGGR